MKKIETLQQLLAERTLSRLRIEQLEKQIEEDFKDIKEDFKPLNIAGKALKNLVTSESDSLVGESIGLTIDSLIKKTLNNQ